MDSLFKLITENTGAIILALIVGIIALTIHSILQSRRIRAIQNRWKVLLDGTKGENIEKILYNHLKERLLLQQKIETLQLRTSELEQKMLTSKRHFGLVKYDAFEEVGGSQSFALAIHDDQGDGAILSSLIGRSDCRVYCKVLAGFRSERTLSQEEQRAITKASETGPQAIVSN